MKSYFSLQLLQKTGFFLFITLLALLSILYAQFIWQVWEQLTSTLNNSVTRADDYLISLGK